MSNTVKVFGRLKDEHGTIVFTCSATTNTGVFSHASDECVRLATKFVATKPKSGCGCSKQSKPTFKMTTSKCEDNNIVTACDETSVLIS
jgi:hypothetical protein